MKINDICLAKGEWQDKCAHILTDSMWLFPASGREKGELDFHGAFIPEVARQLIERYTCKGDVVLDLFLGSGTTAVEAVKMGRKCIGVDINDKCLSMAADKLPFGSLKKRRINAEVALLQTDSMYIGVVVDVKHALFSLTNTSFAQLLILHPPYHDIIKFGDHPKDLSNMPSTSMFYSAFKAVARNGYDLLEPGRFAAVIIGDKYVDGELVPLGFKCLGIMNEVGFKTKAIIVKDIQGNEVKGKNTNLWRYRALSGGFYIFKHEYILVMYKDGG